MSLAEYEEFVLRACMLHLKDPVAAWKKVHNRQKKICKILDTRKKIRVVAKDTDFTVKLVDVHPDGTAYNIDDTIQRARFRAGYDRQVFMQPGEVYELELGPLSTSALFDRGHRIQVEVSSSNFPRFARNLNTGGRNWDETEAVVAHNVVHHSERHPSQIRLPVVPRGQ